MDEMIVTQNYGVYILLALVIVSGTTGQLFEDPENPTVYCFQCNSGIDIDCIELQPLDSTNFHYKPCLDTDKYNGSIPFCRKIVQKIFPRDNLERVIRRCGWVRHPRLDCYNVRNEDHIETICQCFENGCNTSSVLQHSMGLITFVLIAQTLFRTRFYE
ncbi:uncharacterized protein LOC124362416 isoform X2 [Homalodisca vitripennis]|uniref:uncharacterized protein LOC124362416 isoform X2 n=1 Tax=Homalodisca vitripennis TaxID=197043 RepID=UPI001EEBD9FA|nr:uncharacterized protein LOC124362416 isoform X2 [Homalodisca vitripennis]